MSLKGKMMHAAPRLFRVVVMTLASSAFLAASSAGQQAPDATPTAAAAAEPAADPGPPPALPSSVERMRVRDGLAAAARNDWPALIQLRDGTSDPLVRRMLQWKLATSSEAPLSFNDLSRALRDLEGWPGRAGMRQRAEQAIFDAPLSNADRITFLRSEGGPATGDGQIALAIALKDSGQRSEANTLASAAWREAVLSSAAEDRALAEFSFSAEEHAARADALLWRDQRTAAQRLAPRVSAADRAVINARIAMQTRQRRGLQAAVDAVPGSRAENPGFLYDRVQYRRRTGSPEEAMPLAVRIDARQAPMAARSDIFREKRFYVARALRAGNHDLAYRLVTNHGLTSGESFADAEWLAGWISLRFRNQPRQAAEHFAHLSENVSAPVSRSRAFYWRAEAARALGQNTEAEALYSEAARYNFTYYGQLAATRGSREAMLSLPETGQPTQATRNRFGHRELVQALRVMADVGAQRDFESIAFYLDDTLDDPMELELLSQMAREQSYHRTALRSAKAGLFRNVVATNAAYPLLDLPARVQSSGRPEPALVLAIIRQESEFDVGAISSANARGLMQLIPSTAQAQARREGVTYERGALTTDGQYNMTLGSGYLADRVDDFAGSYVLAIASYNAGAHNVRGWIEDWGDPRSRSVDTIDWIELIPFSETRNYVQRVTENLQVYRHRLAGRPTPITLEQDLNRGER